MDIKLIYDTLPNKRIRYKIQMIGVDRFSEFKEMADKGKLSTLDLREASISDKLLNNLNDLEELGVKLLLSDDIDSRYRRLVNGGYFQKQQDPEQYITQLFTAAKTINKNWLVYEDLAEEQGIKQVVEVLDYGDPLSNRPIRYRKLKSYLTQPVKLHNYLKDNTTGYQTCWEVGTWVWGDVYDAYFGVHLPSTEEEYIILELLRGVFDGTYTF